MSDPQGSRFGLTVLQSFSLTVMTSIQSLQSSVITVIQSYCDSASLAFCLLSSVFSVLSSLLFCLDSSLEESLGRGRGSRHRCLAVAWRLLGGCLAITFSLLEAGFRSWNALRARSVERRFPSISRNIRQTWRLEPSSCRGRPPQNAVKTNVFLQNRIQKFQKRCKLQRFLNILPKICLPSKPKKLHPEGQNLTTVSRSLMKGLFCNLDF